ncbi:hypothetical protein BDQ12DRAFT_672243 [Crucibulum laeve]|uniref:DUF6534 domain-containing protein n=1 Tax=Crucibulum laeve TaxID=68775 RepID=A0A5C3MH88_9AGAR|nr:hypothetical protein BDQ12DRAFT_672243 [Crucibulum laeve]
MSSSEPIDIGGPFIGIYSTCFLCAALWGISNMQLYMYFIQYSKDNWALKGLAVWMWALGTVAQGLFIVGLSKLVFIRWEEIPNNSSLPLPEEIVAEALISGLSGASTQLFFVYRLWKFTQQKRYPVILIPLILTQLALSLLTAAVVTGSQAAIVLLEREFKTLSVTIFILGIIVDVGIAASMGYQLLTHRSGMTHSNRMVSYLFTLSIASGFWTAFTTGVSIVVFFTSNNSLNYSGVYISLCPIYTNTVLANLNVRQYISSQGQLGSALGSLNFATKALGQPINSRNMPNTLTNIDISLEETSYHEAQSSSRGIEERHCTRMA